MRSLGTFWGPFGVTEVPGLLEVPAELDSKLSEGFPGGWPEAGGERSLRGFSPPVREQDLF